MTRRVGRLLLGTYAVVVAFALLWPDGWAINRFFVGVYLVGLRLGVTWMGPEDYSTLANALAFAPLGYGLVVGWPRVRPWLFALALAGVSCLSELVQLGLARQPSVSDVLLNSFGAVAGTLLGTWRLRKLSERSERLTP